MYYQVITELWLFALLMLLALLLGMRMGSRWKVYRYLHVIDDLKQQVEDMHEEWAED